MATTPNRERERKRHRKGCMSESEIMTIIIAFHMSHQRDFKNFYVGIIHRYHKNEFPTLRIYTRFLEVMPCVLVPLSSFFTHLKGEPTGIEFIDSTSIKVCHNCGQLKLATVLEFSQYNRSDSLGVRPPLY